MNKTQRRLWPLLLLPLLAVMAGCADREVKFTPAEMHLYGLLDDIRRGAEPGETKSCLSTRAYDVVEIVDDTRLVFLARNGSGWINELRAPCAGLRRDHALIFDLRSSSACQMDRVQGFRPGLTGAGLNRTNPAALCVLGKFTEIPEYRVPRVVQALKAL